MKKILFVVAFFFAFFSAKATEPDSTKIILYSWKLDTYITKTALDTCLTGFETYQPLLKESVSNSLLGNWGLAAQSNFFLQQEHDKTNAFIFLDAFRQYRKFSENTKYYHTSRHFTQIIYTVSTSTLDEKSIRLLHTQNIKKNWNMGLEFDASSSTGKLLHAKTGIYAFRLFSSYFGEKYSNHSNFTVNIIHNQDNGGLTEIASESSALFQTQLSDAETALYDINFTHIQKLKLWGKTSNDSLITSRYATKGSAILHKLSFEKSDRVYTDKNSINASNSDIYIDYFFNDKLTYDSLYLFSIKNSLQWEVAENVLPKIKLGLQVGVLHEFSQYYIPNPSHFLKGYSLLNYSENTDYQTFNDNSYQNLSLTAKLFGKLFQTWLWNADADYCFQGFRKGDYSLKSWFSKQLNDSSELKFSFDIKNAEANIFLQKFFSNHFTWINSFEKTNSTHGSAEYSNTKWKLQLKGDWLRLNNFIYFNQLSEPQQVTDAFDYFSLSVSQRFKLRNFHFSNRLLWQKSTNSNVLHLPELAIFSSNYYENRLFKKVLLVQLGVNIRYSTSFYSAAYMPAIGQFHLQNQEKTGNYPLIDIFINLKIKQRARLFFKWEQVAGTFDGKIHYPVAFYPAAGTSYKFGVSWLFYD